MATFKIGDRVKVKMGVLANKTGTVRYILPNCHTEGILVEFDDIIIGGHNGRPQIFVYYDDFPTNLKDGHCYYMYKNSLEKIREKRRIIKMELKEGKYICEGCGKEFDEWDIKSFRMDGEDHILCDDCFYENYSVCKICGEIMEIGDEEYVTYDGDAYCSRDCAMEDLRICYDCGCYIEDSSDEYSIASRYGNGHEVICGDCRDDHWRYCDDCDDLFYDDDLNHHEYGDCYYCDNCYDYHNRGDYDGINDYHDGPMLVYYDKDGTMEDQTGTDFKGYGFELEVDCGGHDHDNAKKVCDMLDEEVYCCSDGSIDDGFEIISHPHTREALEKMPMDDVLEWLRKQGYKSHDAKTCGLHIHASKLLFGEEEKDRIRNIAKIVMFYEIFWDDILKVSRRTEEQVNRWAKKYGRGKKDTYDMVDTAIKGGYYGGGRYFAVNLCNKHTVEFRLMRGTLKSETFWATLDFIMTTVENAKWIPLAQINKAELWLRHMKQETLDYIRSRGAFASVVGQNNTVEENNEEE